MTNQKRIQTAITLLKRNGYRVHKIGAPAIRPRIDGCDAACSEAKHTRACLARKYRKKSADISLAIENCPRKRKSCDHKRGEVWSFVEESGGYRCTQCDDWFDGGRMG